MLAGNVLHLGLVSLFTDLSSEIIYPLLPVFLAGLVGPGATAFYVGLMEGVAESTSSILKIVSGMWSDARSRRKPFALAGYAISSVARPLMALATSGWHVVFLRFVDRIGKGVRTSPRDALLGGSAEPDVRGRAFSLHRMMDHAGALAGSLTAVLFLRHWLGRAALWQAQGSPGNLEMRVLRWLFAWALLPGVAALLILWWRVEEREEPLPQGAAGAESMSPETSGAVLPDANLKAASPGRLPRRYYIYLGAVVLFTLGNSSDLFLVLQAQSRFQMGPGGVILFWMTLHLSKILCSLPGGWFSDLRGRRPAMVAGWLLHAAVYLVMPFTAALWGMFSLFVLYGVFYGLTEGAERALVADLVPPDRRGRAYGFFHGAVGLATLPASLLFGVVWMTFGPVLPFLLAAALALAAAPLLAYSVRGLKTSGPF
ncbi:MAG: MFS transporter [Acidobacteriota bacterium]